MNHCSFFGTPSNLVSDKGPAFTSEVFKDLMTILGVSHKKTLTGSKEEAGIVERLNKEVTRHLRNLIFDKRVYNSWSQYVPLVQRIINSMPHTATGITPAEIITPALNLQRNLIPDRDLEETEVIEGASTFPDWINHMLSKQVYLTEKAIANLKTRDERHIASKTLSHKGELTYFPIGSYVLAENMNFFTQRKETNKLLPYMKGPFRVESHSEDLSNYTVRNLISMRLRSYHCKSLRKFESRPEDTDLTTYAVRDVNFWIVKSILDFKPKSFDGTSPRRLLQFYVEWEIDGSKTWEPWSIVRKLKALRIYAHSAVCKNKHLKKIVPLINDKEEEIESDEDFEKDLDSPYWTE